MELKIIDAQGKNKGSINLPAQFTEPLRPDLIKRAVRAVASHNRAPYGASPEAGKRSSVRISKRRHDYRGCYGIGISRIPRKIFTRRGTRMNWQGAFAPGTVGGRRAHPPKAEKIWWEDLNKKERKKAIRSAIAATADKTLVEDRGHKIPDNFPFVLDSDLQKIKKTKEVFNMLKNIGFGKELQRAQIKKVRAGKGKNRGRKYTKKKSVLFIVDQECSLFRSGHNIPGTEICQVNNLNAELLAPGGNPGRLTLWSKSAIEKLEKEKLFT